MTFGSLTYVFTNGTTADGDQVNQNFTDLINITSDGVSDFSIAALTVAGTATLNGNVTLGNSSGDDITYIGSLASTIPIKTTATYNIGSATLGLAGVYFGANSQTVRVVGSGSMSATWTLTLPVAAGTKGQVLQTDGAGVSAWVPGQTDISAAGDADYTILDTDGFGTVTCAPAGATARTITLPTASDNTDRKITIIHMGAGAGKVTVDGEGAETINGKTTIDLYVKYDRVTLICDGTEWLRLEGEWHWAPYTPTYTGFGTVSSSDFEFKRIGDTVKLRGKFVAGTTTAVEGKITLPTGLTVGSLTLNPAIVGTFVRSSNSSDFYSSLATGGDAFLNFGRASGSSALGTIIPSMSAAFGSGNTGFMTADVKITEWA